MDDERPAATAGRPVLAAAMRLDGIGIAGLDRRRAWLLAGTFLTIWVVAVFARQVGDASAASLEADRIRSGNAALAAEIESLRAELGRIQDVAFVAQQARAYDLGAGRERAFALSPDAPPLAEDAPGSASHRLGAAVENRSPLEVWLSLLFGPAE